MAYFAFGGTNLQKGAQGDSVKRIQEALNGKGYSLTVDGIWGDKTDAAIRDYQGKNGLSVDGIYGKNTHASLFGKSPTESVGDFKYNPYKESDAVTSAKNNATTAADAVANYGDFSYGKQGDLDGILDKILNREDFSYDLNGDALYQQYKDKHIQQGKMAMQDTMGQAAALTGGYGNSYASTAGNQAYQAHLNNLNDIIPELQQMAYDRYRQEGQDLYNQYGLLSDDRATQYGEWSDAYNRAIANRDYTQGVYDSERTYDYGVWGDGRDFAYGQHRDSVGDARWEAEFNEGVRQYEEKMAAANATGTGGGSGSGGGSSSGSGSSGNSGSGGGGSTYNNGDYSEDIVKRAQAFVGASQDGKWGQDSAAVAKSRGYKSLKDVVARMGVKSPSENNTHEKIRDIAEAQAYLLANGVHGRAGDILTGTEWQRRRNSYKSTGQGGAEVANYDTYEDYLTDIVVYLVNNYK